MDLVSPRRTRAATALRRAATWLAAAPGDVVEVVASGAALGPAAARGSARGGGLDAALAAWRGDIAGARRVAVVRRALLAGGAVLLVVRVVGVVAGADTRWAAAVAGVLVFCGVVVVAARERASLGAVARLLDRRLGLAERVATGYELTQQHGGDATPLRARVVAEAADLAAGLRATRRAAPRRAGAEWASLAGVVLLTGLALALGPGAAGREVPTERAAAPGNAGPTTTAPRTGRDAGTGTTRPGTASAPSATPAAGARATPTAASAAAPSATAAPSGSTSSPGAARGGQGATARPGSGTGGRSARGSGSSATPTRSGAGTVGAQASSTQLAARPAATGAPRRAGATSDHVGGVGGRATAARPSAVSARGGSRASGTPSGASTKGAGTQAGRTPSGHRTAGSPAARSTGTLRLHGATVGAARASGSGTAGRVGSGRGGTGGTRTAAGSGLSAPVGPVSIVPAAPSGTPPAAAGAVSAYFSAS